MTQCDIPGQQAPAQITFNSLIENYVRKQDYPGVFLTPDIVIKKAKKTNGTNWSAFNFLLISSSILLALTNKDYYESGCFCPQCSEICEFTLMLIVV